ncbi:hypothetical protein AAF712_014250 [Marasmius tenuissimus]|uniref:RNase H type-1 domain-containing protein n=1 Tax=Marasmius tenuissimus TaxID=585030 RepID=A0ABR2ZF18_9AGAR
MEARNLTIEVMWLRSYLNLADERPIWAKVADVLIAAAIPTNPTERNVNPKVKANVFLQSWETKISALPDHLKRMLTTAKDLRLRTEGIAFSKKILRQQPIWYHNDARPRLRLLNNSLASNCLKEKHKLFTVGQAEGLAESLQRTDHIASDERECPDCKKIEENYGCSHPHRCMTRAKELLDALHPKWDPRREIQPENYEQTPEESEIDSRVTTNGALGDVFRVYWRRQALHLPPEEERPAAWKNEEGQRTLTIGGITLGENKEEGLAGASILANNTGTEPVLLKVPREINITSKRECELLAIEHILENTPEDLQVNIEGVSSRTAKLLSSSLPKMEDNGFVGVPNRDLIKKIIAKVRQRKRRTIVKKTDGKDPDAIKRA